MAMTFSQYIPLVLLVSIFVGWTPGLLAETAPSFDALQMGPPEPVEEEKQKEKEQVQVITTADDFLIYAGAPSYVKDGVDILRAIGSKNPPH